MASTRDTDIMRTKLYVKSYDVDPGDTVAEEVAWVNVKDYTNYLVQMYTPVAMTGTSCTLAIVGNTAAAGAGTDYTIKTQTFTTTTLPEDVGDQVFLEIAADEIAQIGSENGADILSLSAVFTAGHADDEVVVTYIFEPSNPADGTTANVIAD